MPPPRSSSASPACRRRTASATSWTPRRHGPPTTCSSRTSAAATSFPSAASWRRTSWRRPAMSVRPPTRTASRFAPPPARARRPSTGTSPISRRSPCSWTPSTRTSSGRSWAVAAFPATPARTYAPPATASISATRWIRARPRGAASACGTPAPRRSSPWWPAVTTSGPRRPPACGTACTTSSTAFWPTTTGCSAWDAGAA